jgi:ribosomal protein L24
MKKTDNTLKYAALYLDSQGKDIEDISEELGITIQKTKSLLKTQTTKKKNQKDSVKTVTSPVNSKNLMITQTEGKKIKSVAIMTKAASEVNDEFRKGLPETVSRTGKDAIFRPNKK